MALSFEETMTSTLGRVLPNKQWLGDNSLMKKSTMYKRYRFPGLGVPQQSFNTPYGFYYRFNVSRRDIEDLLAQRGIIAGWTWLLFR